MRLLLFADLHLDAPFAWAGPEVARRRVLIPGLRALDGRRQDLEVR